MAMFPKLIMMKAALVMVAMLPYAEGRPWTREREGRQYADSVGDSHVPLLSEEEIRNIRKAWKETDINDIKGPALQSPKNHYCVSVAIAFALMCLVVLGFHELTKLANSGNKKAAPTLHNVDEFLEKFKTVTIAEASEMCSGSCAICLGDWADVDNATSTPCADLGTSSVTHHERIKATPCGHVFHKACIAEWMKCSLMCPICRRDLGCDFAALQVGAISVPRSTGDRAMTADGEMRRSDVTDEGAFFDAMV